MAKPVQPLILDGTHLEGGGALVRTAFTVAAMLARPVQIQNVRAGTNFPGIDVEDIVLTRALLRMCGGSTTGMEQGSLLASFEPKHAPKAISGDILNITTESGRGINAAAVAAALVPVLATTGALSEFSIQGETCAQNSLSTDYFSQVISSVWRKMNIHAFVEHSKAAYSRLHTGEILVTVEPGTFEGLMWAERGEPRQLSAKVTWSNMGPSAISRLVSHLQRLAQGVRATIDIESVEVPSVESGLQLTVWRHHQRGIGGGSVLGTKSLKPEQLTHAAFDKFMNWAEMDASLDPIVAEHVIIPACFAHSSSEFKVSQLTKRFLTAVWVIKQFVPVRIVVLGTEGEQGHVTIFK